MRSLWCVLAWSCVGCASTETAPDAAADRSTVEADAAPLGALDALDALDATLRADLAVALEAAVDARADVSGDRASRDVEVDVASPCSSATQRACDGVCLDVSSDDLRCGACDQRCAGDTTCQGGRCVRGCLYGEEVCGSCTVNRGDSANCGA